MDILSSIGHTSLIELTNLNHNKKVKVFAKIEGGNPGGAIDIFIAGMGTGGTLMGVAIVPDIFDIKRLDEKITVDDDSSYLVARKLATQEGIFVGMSGGASVLGALEMAKRMKSGTIVTVLPDRGDWYLSTT